MQFDYFYQEESENFAFYRTPKVLCTDKRFQGLSSDAKLLYGILLDRITAYDELELDTLGDKKTALFLIMSDTDATFNFLISMVYTQLFNLLCEKADDVYGGRLPYMCGAL